MFEYLWSKSFRKRTSMRKRAPAKRRLIPRLELLEDRCLPTTGIAEFPLPAAGSVPFGITTGPDGNIWFTEDQANKIGMINPTTHAISEFAIPTAGSNPLEITAGPGSTIWFTENAANQIGEINPATDAISEFSIPTANSH